MGMFTPVGSIDKKQQVAQSEQASALSAFYSAASDLEHAAQLHAEVAEEARVEAARLAQIQISSNEESRRAAQAAERMREFFNL